MLEDINKFLVVIVEIVISAIIIVAKLDVCSVAVNVAIVENPFDLLSLHFETIVLLGAACAFIFKEKVDERLLDISYKFWIVKTVRGNISVLSLLVLIGSSFLGSAISCFIGVLIPQYIFYILSLVLFSILCYHLYSVTSKKSILYKNIMKQLLTNNHELAKKILQKWKNNYSNCENKKHNSYIEEELLIGYILFCKYHHLEDNGTKKSIDYTGIIKTTCKMILDKDNRTKEDIIDYLSDSDKYYRSDGIILYINDKIPYRTKYDFLAWINVLEE